MADVTISFVIPSVHVPVAKAAVEAYAKDHGDLPPDSSFTPAQAKDYMSDLCIARLIELIRGYKRATGIIAAVQVADSETDQIVIVIT